MTQITEKDRNKIALSIGKLTIKEAEQIKAKCRCSMDTVYREWRKMRTPRSLIKTENEITAALIDLAALRVERANEIEKAVRNSMKQISTRKAKQEV